MFARGGIIPTIILGATVSSVYLQRSISNLLWEQFQEYEVELEPGTLLLNVSPCMFVISFGR